MTQRARRKKERDTKRGKIDREGAYGKRPERGENIRREARCAATPSNFQHPRCLRLPLRRHFLPISRSGSNPRTGSPALSFTSVAPGVSTRQHVVAGDLIRGSGRISREFSVHHISFSAFPFLSLSLSVRLFDYLLYFCLCLSLSLVPILHHPSPLPPPDHPLPPSSTFSRVRGGTRPPARE